MKNFLLLSFICLLQQLVFAQSTVPVWFVIDDEDTHREIAGAMVSVKQAGYDTKPTGGDGRVKFENVPVGQIDFNIMKDGYQFRTGQANVSSEIKNNTFRLSLFKMPTAKDPTILVTGEVNDADGRDLENVLVEVKMADVVRTVATDASGNYSADIKPNPNFPASTVRIEVKKGDCKKTELVELNGAKMIYKDVKLDCAGGSPSGGSSTKTKEEQPAVKPAGQPLSEKTVNGVKFTLDRFEQPGSTVTLHFTLENITAAKAILETSMNGRGGELIDQEGNIFKSSNITVGNGQGEGNVSLKLIYGTPVKGKIQFDVGAIKVTRIAMFKIRLSNLGNGEFVNVNVK